MKKRSAIFSLFTSTIPGDSSGISWSTFESILISPSISSFSRAASTFFGTVVFLLWTAVRSLGSIRRTAQGSSSDLLRLDSVFQFRQFLIDFFIDRRKALFYDKKSGLWKTRFQSCSTDFEMLTWASSREWKESWAVRFPSWGDARQRMELKQDQWTSWECGEEHSNWDGAERIPMMRRHWFVLEKGWQSWIDRSSRKRQ